MNVLSSHPMYFYVSGVLLLFFFIGWIHDGKVNLFDKVLLWSGLYGFYLFFQETISSLSAGFGFILPILLIFFATIFIDSILAGGKIVAMLAAIILLSWVSYGLMPAALELLPGETDKLATVVVLSVYLLILMLLRRRHERKIVAGELSSSDLEEDLSEE